MDVAGSCLYLSSLNVLPQLSDVAGSAHVELTWMVVPDSHCATFGTTSTSGRCSHGEHGEARIIYLYFIQCG